MHNYLIKLHLLRLQKKKKLIVHLILHSTLPDKSKIPKTPAQRTKVLSMCDQRSLEKNVQEATRSLATTG